MTRILICARILGVIALAVITLGAVGWWGLKEPTRPDGDVFLLKQTLHDRVREFSALEADRFVSPAAGQALDRYTLDLVTGAHKLEDVATIALELPLYDLATARTPEARASAVAHVQHGLTAVRAILDNDIGRGQDEYNEGDVLVRLRGVLILIEGLPGVRAQ